MLPPTAFGLNDCEEGGAARFNNRAHVAMFVFMSTARKKCLPEKFKSEDISLKSNFLWKKDSPYSSVSFTISTLSSLSHTQVIYPRLTGKWLDIQSKEVPSGFPSGRIKLDSKSRVFQFSQKRV